MTQSNDWRKTKYTLAKCLWRFARTFFVWSLFQLVTCSFFLQDARESIAEISHLDWSVLVMTMLEKLVEKAGKTRKLLGQLLFDMIKERQMSLEDLTKGWGFCLSCLHTGCEVYWAALVWFWVLTAVYQGVRVLPVLFTHRLGSVLSSVSVVLSSNCGVPRGSLVMVDDHVGIFEFSYHILS